MIAICTATKKALVGVSISGKEKYDELDANCKHSENVMLTIDRLLDEIGEEIGLNDAYSVVYGPGSFTGLRISVALVKGLLAGGGNKKIIGITTSQLMAYCYIKNKRPTQSFVTVINALSGKYYICEFDKDGKVLETDKLILEEELKSIGIKKIGLSEEELDLVDEFIEPSARELLQLSKEKEALGDFILPQNLTPLYLRKSQAEEENIKKI